MPDRVRDLPVVVRWRGTPRDRDRWTGRRLPFVAGGSAPPPATASALDAAIDVRERPEKDRDGRR